MKVVVISGSRNPEGQTAQAASAFVDGLRSHGAEGDTLFLPAMNVERCRQCRNDGWGDCTSHGTCAIDDDFAAIVEKIKTSDAVAFATPVYWGDLSESLRAFLDRLRRTCMHDQGRERIEGKLAIGICVAGGGGGGAPSCTESLDKILRICGFNVVDVIPARRQNLDLKLRILKETGSHLASGGYSLGL